MDELKISAVLSDHLLGVFKLHEIFPDFGRYSLDFLQTWIFCEFVKHYNLSE